METSQSKSQSHDIEIGLKSLTLCCPINDKKLHQNPVIIASSLTAPPPPSPAFSHIDGDYIGMESCLDMTTFEDVQIMMNVNNVTTTTSFHHHVRSKRDSIKKERKFPPPITLLARMEDLSPPHMPFVLKRYYTSDGRLILREERGRHHEYIRVHRSNGHLTLQILPSDDEDEEEEEEAFSDFDDEIENEHEHSQESEENVEEEDEIEGSVDQIPDESCTDVNEGIEIDGKGKGEGGGGGGGMCLKYNNAIITTSSCYLDVPEQAPEINPVYT